MVEISIPDDTLKVLLFESVDDINQFINILEENAYQYNTKTVDMEPLNGFEGTAGKEIYSFKDADKIDKVLIKIENFQAAKKEIYNHLFTYMKVTKKDIMPAIYSIYRHENYDTYIIEEDFSIKDIELERYFTESSECNTYLETVNKIIKQCFEDTNVKESHEYLLWTNTFEYILEGQEYTIKEMKNISHHFNQEENNKLKNAEETLQDYFIYNLMYFYFPYNDTINYNLALFYDTPQSPFKKLMENFFITTFYFNINFIFHNDLHPKNVFINTNTHQIRIIDFGIATIHDDKPKYIKLRNNWDNVDDRNKLLGMLFDKEFNNSIKKNQFNISFMPRCINPGILRSYDLPLNKLTKHINTYITSYYFNIIKDKLYIFFKQRYIEIISTRFPTKNKLPLK